MPLEADLAAALEAAGRGAPPPDFAAWALRIFAHQFERNAPYRAFCERRGVTPATVARWEDVPAVPSAAFRRVDLACGPPEAVFRTSGTSGAGARGRHLVPCLALYRASALATFAPFVLPDAARLPCLCLAPPPALRPESSLVQMCVWVGEGLASGVEWMIGAPTWFLTVAGANGIVGVAMTVGAFFGARKAIVPWALLAGATLTLAFGVLINLYAAQPVPIS